MTARRLTYTLGVHRCVLVLHGRGIVSTWHRTSPNRYADVDLRGDALTAGACDWLAAQVDDARAWVAAEVAAGSGDSPHVRVSLLASDGTRAAECVAQWTITPAGVLGGGPRDADDRSPRGVQTAGDARLVTAALAAHLRPTAAA